MTEKGWFARRVTDVAQPAPAVRLHVREEPAPEEETADSAPALQDDPESPAEYQAVRHVRTRANPACIFIPPGGRAFAREYAYKSGQDWLPEGATGGEGFEITYAGHVVTIRGKRLWEVFVAMAEHRAHTVRAFDSRLWRKAPEDGPVIEHIAVRFPEPVGRGRVSREKGPEGP